MTKLYYATSDHNDDGLIAEGAYIVAFATRDEAEAYLRGGLDPEHWDLSEATIEFGRFGDCWRKFNCEPTDKNLWYDAVPFSVDELIILPPGQHPGGNAWWVTPRVDVLVLTGLRPVEG